MPMVRVSNGGTADITGVPQYLQLKDIQTSVVTITNLNNPSIVMLETLDSATYRHIVFFDLKRNTSLDINLAVSPTYTHYNSLTAGNFSVSNATSTSIQVKMSGQSSAKAWVIIW